MASDESQPLDTCNSEVELSMLASGMAKQHESYQDALQELIDNAVSSIVKDEQYFNDPDESLTIVISLVKRDDTIRTTVADDGPGISLNKLSNEIFKTGNKSVSDGILNNVGWGLKASLAWFEETLRGRGATPSQDWFELVTAQQVSNIKRVEGPITGNLPVLTGTKTDWDAALTIGNHSLPAVDHGTRVHVSCNWTRFAEDVWPSANTLETKSQALREYLGVRYRDVLTATSDNQIYIDYRDETTGQEDSLEVIPITPIYKPNDEKPPETHDTDTFSIELSDGSTFEVEYERGTLDYERMTAVVADIDSDLLTASGRFRTRYRPSQSRQGVDIYANGRLLMTSVFTELFDLTRNNEYNYFGGEVRITPTDPTTEVPTDNKKTRIDTNSELWQKLCTKLTKDEYLPSGKRYDTVETDETALSNSQGGDSHDAGTASDPATNDTITRTQTPDKSDLQGMHQADALHLKEYLTTIAAKAGTTVEGDIDLAITSPPYFDLKDYGYDDAQQIGQRNSYAQYLDDLKSVFSQVYDLLSDDGSLWVIIDDFRENHEVVDLPSDIADICRAVNQREVCPHCSSSDFEVPLVQQSPATARECLNCEYTAADKSGGWHLRDILIWDKHHALPYTTNDQFRNVFEYILCFSKTPSTAFQPDNIRIADPAEFEDWWVSYPERYNPRGMIPRNIWEFDTLSQGSFGAFESLDHPAPFPPKLVERILNVASAPGDTVLDPFAGSGMVPATAEALDRQSIGVEMSPKFCQAYADLKPEVAQQIEAAGDTTPDQEQLAELIMALRMLKKPREILRLHAKSREGGSISGLEIQTVFQLCHEFDIGDTAASTQAKSELIYVLEDGIENERRRNLQRSFDEEISTAPLSRYETTTSVSVLSQREAINRLDETLSEQIDEFYLYETGQFYTYESRKNLGQWIANAAQSGRWARKYAADDFPPTLSTIGASVTNPRYLSEQFSLDKHAEIEYQTVRSS